MPNDKLKRSWFIFFSCCLICLLSACSTSSSNPPSPQATDTHPARVVTPTPTIAPTTVPMPVTQTSCPATGTARAMVTAPLILGSHPTIVYTVNQSAPNSSDPLMGTLKRYDVTTGSKTVLVSIPNVSIDNAQISTDGQWVLFTSRSKPSPTSQSGPESDVKLQLIRMDGQGLQTLYCTTAGYWDFYNQWSPDQQFIAIRTATTDNATPNPNNVSTVQLLHTSTGQLQNLFTLTDSPVSTHLLDFWADNTHLSLHESEEDGFHDIYLVDITKGSNQQAGDFTTLLKGPFRSFTGDGKKLYIDYNGCSLQQSICSPPSTVIALPATGGTSQTIWHSTQYNLTQVCPFNDHPLLIAIVNYQVPIGTTDISHNGIWLMNSDGTLAERIVPGNLTYGPNPTSLIGVCSSPWSHASRDGSMYALMTRNNDNNERQLIFGKTNSGTSTPFATFGNGITGDMVGWTTM